MKTPCPDRAIRQICNEIIQGDNVEELTAEELKQHLNAKSLLGHLRVNVGVGEVNRKTPVYSFMQQFTSFTKEKVETIRKKVPDFQKREGENCSTKELCTQLRQLSPDERFYLEGNELSELYGNAQNFTDQQLKYLPFGSMGGLPPLERMEELLKKLQQIVKGRKEPLSDQKKQDDLWSDYVAQAGNNDKLSDCAFFKIVSGSICADALHWQLNRWELCWP